MCADRSTELTGKEEELLDVTPGGGNSGGGGRDLSLLMVRVNPHLALLPSASEAWYRT